MVSGGRACEREKGAGPIIPFSAAAMQIRTMVKRAHRSVSLRAVAPLPRFRFFSKKRGDHRTTSDLGARLATAGFFAVLTALGAALLGYVLRLMTIAEWRANHDFVESRAVVLDAYVASAEVEGVTKFRPEIVIRYDADGRTHTAQTFDVVRVFVTDREICERNLEEFRVGGEYPCWYDPSSPDKAVLKRGYSWYAWLLPLLPAAFTAVGFGGLVYQFLTWGKSTEHRAMLQQATNLDLFDTRRMMNPHPTIPDDDVAGSPGTTLKYRVPTTQPGWNVIVLGAVCFGWNLLVAWFVYRVVLGHLGSRGDLVLTIGLVPFVAVGGYLLHATAKLLMVTAGVPPTVLEISEHPLYPGGRYKAYLYQPGRLKLERLTVSLCCDEEAMFRQGTNSRTHVLRVIDREVFRRESFEPKSTEPFTARFDLTIPSGAMHSFRSSHNAVRWKLVVRGRLHKWPDFERSFSLIVYPGCDGAKYA